MSRVVGVGHAILRTVVPAGCLWRAAGIGVVLARGALCRWLSRFVAGFAGRTGWVEKCWDVDGGIVCREFGRIRADRSPIAGACTLLSSSLLACSHPPVFGQVSSSVYYVDGDSASTPSFRQAPAGTFGAQTDLASSSADLAAIRASVHPSDGSLALLLLQSDGALVLRHYAGGSWGSPIAVATGVSVADPAPIAVAHNRKSGTLHIAYATSGSSLSVRTFDGAMSAEETVGMGFAATPSRVELVASPISNAVTLAASTGARLSASVWDGTGFGAATTLDASYNGGDRRWAIGSAPTGSRLCYGRVLRTMRCVSAVIQTGSWASEQPGPSGLGVVVRVAAFE